MRAQGMFGWMLRPVAACSSDGLVSRRLPGDHEKSRRNPGPMSWAGLGHVCTMFGPAEYTFEDLEGKSSSEPLGTPVAQRCKRMPADDRESPGIAPD